MLDISTCNCAALVRNGVVPLGQFPYIFHIRCRRNMHEESAFDMNRVSNMGVSGSLCACTGA